MLKPSLNDVDRPLFVTLLAVVIVVAIGYVVLWWLFAIIDRLLGLIF